MGLKRKAPKPQKPFVSEFEKYEKVYFQRNPPLAKPDEGGNSAPEDKAIKKSAFLFSEGDPYVEDPPL